MCKDCARAARRLSESRAKNVQRLCEGCAKVERESREECAKVERRLCERSERVCKGFRERHKRKNGHKNGHKRHKKQDIAETISCEAFLQLFTMNQEKEGRCDGRNFRTEIMLQTGSLFSSGRGPAGRENTGRNGHPSEKMIRDEFTAPAWCRWRPTCSGRT